MSFLVTAGTVAAGSAITGGTIAAGAGLLGAGLGAVNSMNQGSPQAPPPRNINQELQALAGQFPQLAGILTGGSGNFNTATSQGLSQLSQGTLNTQAYAQARPDLVANFNSDPGYAQMYGSLDNYLRADFEVNEPNKAQYLTGGLPQVAAGLNTQNRAANLADVANMAGQYQGIIQGANQPYYNQLSQFTQAANAPIQPGAAQQQLGAMASQAPGQSAAQQQLAQMAQQGFAPGASQQQAAAMAQQGFGQFDPSGLYARTNFTSQQVNAATGNPLLDALNQRALAQTGPGQLQQQQNAIAQQLLADGGNLSASDLRNVQQASRGGFAARGLGGTNASVVDEVLQTDAAQRARLIQNLGIAQGVQNQGMAEQNLQQQFGLGVGSQNFGYDQLGLEGQRSNQAADLQAQQMGLQGQIANQGFGLNSFQANVAAQQAQQRALMESAQLAEQQRQAQVAALQSSASMSEQQRLSQLAALQGVAGMDEQQRQAQLAAMQAATNAQAQGRIDPYAAILGGTNDQLGGLLGLYGNTQNQQSSLLNSLLGYGQDLSNTNYNAQAAAGIAGYNQQQGLNSSLIGAGTNLLGSYLGTQGGYQSQPSGQQLLGMLPSPTR